MTPYEIDVLLHYYTRACDHADIERNPPIWRPTVESFLSQGLLRTDGGVSETMHYSLTERGHAYVEALRRVPLPEATWTVNWPDTMTVACAAPRDG